MVFCNHIVTSLVLELVLVLVVVVVVVVLVVVVVVVVEILLLHHPLPVVCYGRSGTLRAAVRWRCVKMRRVQPAV